MRCPSCGDDFEDGIETCPDCRVPLVPAGAEPPPMIDAKLGTFHPDVAGQLILLLEHRGIRYETVGGPDGVELLVDRTYRDDLRSELLMRWTEIVSGLEQDRLYEVLGEGGSCPGWYDAPTGTWVDRHGRLQVAAEEDEETEEARRVVGPSLATLGAVLLLFGWWGGGGNEGLWVVLGGALTLIGLFLPR